MNHQSTNLSSNYHNNHPQLSQYNQSQSQFSHHHYNGSAGSMLQHQSNNGYRGSNSADLHLQSRDMSEDGDQLLDEEDEDEDEDEENTERPIRRALSQESRSRSVSPPSHDDYYSKLGKHKRQKLEAISPRPNDKSSLISTPTQIQPVLQSQFNSIYGQHSMFPHTNGFLNAYAAITATEPHNKSSFVSPLSLIPPLPLPGLLPSASLSGLANSSSSSSSSSLVRPTVVKPKKCDISNIESLIESSSSNPTATISHEDSDIKYRPDNSLTSSIDVSSNTNESSSSSSCNNSPSGANRSSLEEKQLPSVPVSNHGMPPHLLWYLYALGSQSVAAGHNSPAEMERFTAAALAAFGCGSATQTPLQLPQSNLNDNQNENLTVSTTNLKAKSLLMNENKHRVQPYSISNFKHKQKHSVASVIQSDLEDELMNKTDESIALNESMKNDDSFVKFQEPEDVEAEEDEIREDEVEEDKETSDQSVSSVGDESNSVNKNLENNNLIGAEITKGRTLNNGGSCQDESCNSSLSVESSLSSSVCLNDSLISPTHKEAISLAEKNDENSN